MEKIDKIIETIPIKKGVITRREYDWLKTFDNLEPHEAAKVAEFEASLQTAEAAKKISKSAIKTIPGYVADKKTIWTGFLQAFKVLNGTEFIQSPSALSDVEPVIKYFAKDESFFECKNLLKTVNGKQLTNSFAKGLLIVGNYGNGKTTVMTTIETMFKQNYAVALHEHWESLNDWSQLRFKGMKSHDLVTEFESINQKISPAGRLEFYKKYSGFRYYFDDVKKEKVASNFGLSEVMREIIEKRYDKNAKTFITCNYKESAPNDIDVALFEFGERYGGHIFDRILEMFNIIEFKGKSFRK